MEQDKPLQTLSRTLDDMQSKSKALNDSLRHLATEGFDHLQKAAQQGSASRSKNNTSEADIIRSELAKFLGQELQNSFKHIFGGTTGNPHADTGGISVIINNHTAAQVTARETGGAFDRKYLEITIDQMVADSLLRGRQTSGVLRSLFGLAPSLMGR